MSRLYRDANKKAIHVLSQIIAHSVMLVGALIKHQPPTNYCLLVKSSYNQTHVTCDPLKSRMYGLCFFIPILSGD